MGVTSRRFPIDNAPNGRSDLIALYDRVPDVEDVVDPTTGKGDIDHAADFVRFLALSHKPVRLFSDLLLYDMGVLADGIEQEGAGRREMRTPPCTVDTCLSVP